MDLVIEQELVCKPGTAYDLWLSAESLASWWWPHITDASHLIDPRVGGSYEIVSAAAGIGVRGEFLSLDAGREIGMTWNWMNNGVSEVSEKVWVRFTPIDGGTVVSVTHELDDIAGDGEDIKQGWQDVLARLAAVV
jgi:uncharacterized protein YndB with AHSA1/START domain